MANVLNKYAESLFEVAQSQGLEKSIHEDLLQIGKAVSGNADFLAFAAHPKQSKEACLNFVESTFKGVDLPLMNMLKILAERKQLSQLAGIADAYTAVFNKSMNQAHMKVESVYPLTSEELDEIGKAFIKRTGYKKLLIENVINESLIGGIRATIGTTVYDGSVMNELNQLQKSFHKQ